MVDYLHAAARVPSVTVERELQLAPVAEARAATAPRPGWCALFTKGWALVSRDNPVLRRSFLSFPYERLYEHRETAVSIAVERDYGEEKAVFFLSLSHPETRPLTEIDHRITDLRTCSLDSRGHLRRQLQQAARPTWLRRWVYWVGLSVYGPWRDRYFGTFGVSSYAGLGAQSMGPLTILTTTLSYGIVHPDGRCNVRVTYDHRVTDGGTIARALAHLETTLNGEIRTELVGCAPGRDFTPQLPPVRAAI
jgi:hypothetical protein